MTSFEQTIHLTHPGPGTSCSCPICCPEKYELKQTLFHSIWNDGVSLSQSVQDSLMASCNQVRQVDPRPPRVYFDMDDVLSAFITTHDRLIGYRMPDGDIVWEEINKLLTFFLYLPVMARAQELWGTVAPKHRYVLSSYSKHNNFSKEQKRQWIHREFPLDDDRIILVRGKVNKVLHCQPGDVLIDDWPENVQQWTAAGGIGILYSEDRFDECVAQIPGWALPPDEFGFCQRCAHPAHYGLCCGKERNI